MLDRDMAQLVQDLLRRPRTRSEVANLLAALATHCALIGLDRPAERCRVGLARSALEHRADRRHLPCIMNSTFPFAGALSRAAWNRSGAIIAGL